MKPGRKASHERVLTAALVAAGVLHASALVGFGGWKLAQRAALKERAADLPAIEQRPQLLDAYVVNMETAPDAPVAQPRSSATPHADVLPASGLLDLPDTAANLESRPASRDEWMSAHTAKGEAADPILQ